MKEGIDRKILNDLMLCAEELTVQGLKALDGVHFPAELTVETDEWGTCRLILTYGGARVNLLPQLNSLSRKLIDGLSTEPEYSFEERNRLSLKIL